MIFKQKFYRSVDHWSDISLFYHQKGASWTRFEKLPIKDTITINDFKKAQAYIEREDVGVLSKQEQSTFYSNALNYISTPENIYVVYNRELWLKSEASNRSRHLELCANLETIHILKTYVFESSIYKVLAKHVIQGIKENNLSKNGLEVCNKCMSTLKSIFESYSGLENFDYIFNVAGKISTCMTLDHPTNCASAINFVFSKVINARSGTISSLLKDLKLRMSISSEALKTADYSEDFFIAFFDIPKVTSKSSYKIVVSNSKKEFLVYTKDGIMCPYSHYNTSKGYTEKCKTQIPSESDKIILHSIEYTHKDNIEGTEYSVSNNTTYNHNFNDLLTIQLNRSVDVFCRSNTKKINIDRSILEKANVRQYIRRK